MDIKRIETLTTSELLSEGQVARLRAREVVEFTPEQRDVIARLEMYPHPLFNLQRTNGFGSGDQCFVCVGGALGEFMDEYAGLLDAAGDHGSNARTAMKDVIFRDGRGTPVVRDYPAKAVPKSVAIEAVKSIFRMSATP